MMRIVRVVPIVFVMTLCASHAFAQTGAAPSGGYAAFDIAATVGHKSDKAIGGEVGFKIRDDIDVFFEGGHIGNAASADMETGANLIANNVGAVANPISKINYFDAGVRYHFHVNAPNVHPYVAIGFGGAHVKNETTFVVNGAALAPEALGIQSGTDLNGTENKPFFMLGAGASIPFRSRYFVDVSYRFGAVIGATSAGPSDTEAIKTNRIQLGLGINFSSPF
jgi:opacity protein-like surface antigen